MSGKNTIDMLHGGLAKPMLLFALPLIASGVLQQSFNSIDVAVVGRFAGSHALAAVGSNGPVIGLLINLFLGLSIGVNVVIANYIGQSNGDGVRRAVRASAIIALASSVIMVVLAKSIARPILEALGTPAECLDQAVLYLHIMAWSMPTLIIFNFGSAILRSVGDTRRPFYCLVGAGIINVALNLLFVIGMDMGVAGVAWGTVISQAISAGAVVLILCRERSDIRLTFSGRLPYGKQIGQILAVGIPAGVQSMVFSISNIFILSAINSFGAIAAAGSAAALNYESYCYFVISAFGQTCVAFTSQNFGAGRLDRCRAVLRISLIYSIATSLLLNATITFFAPYFSAVFTADPAVQVFACHRIATVLLFQWIACYYEMAGSWLRGTGYSMTPALITIFGTCFIRLLWVGFFPADGTFSGLLAIYPVSWLLTDIIMYTSYLYIRRRLAAKIVEGPMYTGG